MDHVVPITINMVMTGSTKIIAIAVVAVVAVAGIAGGAFYLMNKDKDDKKLVIATSPDFPNYEYMYGEEFAGIDMDIIRAICDELGYKPKFENVTFDGILVGVSTGKYDVGASGFTITDERKESVLFSEPYTKAKQLILSTETVTSTTWFEGKKIAVQSYTTGEYVVTAPVADGGLGITGEDRVHSLKTYTDCVQELKNGKVDCVILDDAPAKVFAAKNAGLVTSDIDLAEDEYYGFAFNKSNTDLQKEFNDALAKLKADGVIDKIIAYYSDAGADKPSYFSQSRGETQSAAAIGNNQTEGGSVPSSNLSAEPVKRSVSSLSDDINKVFFENGRLDLFKTGLKNTLIITALSLILGLFVGIVLAIIRSVHDMMGKLKVLNVICKTYIAIIRGTPVVIQLLIIYFIIFATSRLNPVFIASIAFGMNSAAYVAEIVRAGINAVPRGQLEAGFSLGMPFTSTMVKVILPQAIKNILPALCNEGITLLKETSISGYIGIIDLTRAGDMVRAQTFEAFLPLIGVALIYLVIVLILTYLVSRLERRLKASAV